MAMRAARVFKADIEDMYSVGAVALVDMDRRGVTLRYSTVTTRCYGAMVDHVRRMAPITRRGLQLGHEFKRAHVALHDLAGKGACPVSSLDCQRMLRDLTPRQATILRLYDVEGWGLREIGERIGVGEARVCQLRKDALRKIREAAA